MISKYIWPHPAPPGPYPDMLAALPKDFIPFAAGLLLARQLQYTWAGDPGRVGEQLTNLFIIRLYKAIAMEELLTRLDNLYRLIDSTLNGTVYEGWPQPDGSMLVLPAIPIAPALRSEQPMRKAADMLLATIALELRNVPFTGAPGMSDTSNTIKTKLLELIAELDQTEEQNAEIIAQLTSVLAAL